MRNTKVRYWSDGTRDERPEHPNTIAMREANTKLRIAQRLNKKMNDHLKLVASDKDAWARLGEKMRWGSRRSGYISFTHEEWFDREWPRS
jgi:hypothetical protein